MVIRRLFNFTILPVIFLSLTSFLLQGCTKSDRGAAAAQSPTPQGPAKVTESKVLPFAGGATQQSVTLANGLEVLLVSNPDFTKASAAMAIPVGSWSDPEEHQGLAHFLEHMLFLGTKEYPKVGEYGSVVARNGGYTNAYTGSMITNYLFEVNTSALPEVLNRFSRFFVSPTLDPAYIEKERKAVHSEFDKNLKQDGWRMWHMFGSMEPVGHPERKFNIGSLTSLADATTDVLRSFYEKHYSSDTMKLVILAPLPLAELKQLAEANFKDVPNRGLKGKPRIAPVPASQPGDWMELKAIGGKNELTIAFPAESYDVNWQSKPGRQLSLLLGTDAPGSLSSLLKRKQWINKLEAGSYDPGAPGIGSGFFFLTLYLSDKGLQNRDEVLKTTFAHLGQLQRDGVKGYYFTQAQTLGRMALQTRGALDGANEASRISALMLNNPALEVNERSALLYVPSPETVDHFLKTMTPENARIVFQAPSAKTDQVDPVFGVEYSVKKIATETKTEWRNAMDSAPAGYQYPSPNPWIPTSVALVTGETATVPRALVDDEKGKLWYQQTSGSIARALAFSTIRIWSPEISKSPRSFLLSKLYAKSFELTQAERFGYESDAEYKVSLTTTADEVVIGVAGYSEFFPKLLGDVLTSGTNKLNTVSISEDDLERLKDEMKQEIASYRVSPAMDRANDHRRALAASPSYEVADYEGLVDSVTLKELSEYAKVLFSQIYIDGLVYGNVSPESVKGLIPSIYENLGAAPLAVADRQYRSKENLLKAGDRFISTVSGSNNNNAMIVQLNTGMRTYGAVAVNDVLGNLMEDDFYTEMRTKQQLGYIVQAGSRTTREATHLLFYIQSTYTPDDVFKRTKSYIDSFMSSFDERLDAEFESSRAGLTQELSRKTSTMPERFKELDELFVMRDADWNYKSGVVAALGKLTKEEVKAHAVKTLTPETQARRSVFYYGAGQSVPKDFGDNVLIKK